MPLFCFVFGKVRFLKMQLHTLGSELQENLGRETLSQRLSKGQLYILI